MTTAAEEVKARRAARQEQRAAANNELASLIARRDRIAANLANPELAELIDITVKLALNPIERRVHDLEVHLPRIDERSRMMGANLLAAIRTLEDDLRSLKDDDKYALTKKKLIRIMKEKGYL